MRDCKSCLYKTGEGCAAWECEYINLDEAAEAYRQTRWIPVTVRVPELKEHHDDPSIGEWRDSGPVLVYHNCHKFYFHVIVGIYEEDGWVDAEDGAEITDVLAWMPLPKAYEEGAR